MRVHTYVIYSVLEMCTLVHNYTLLSLLTVITWCVSLQPSCVKYRHAAVVVKFPTSCVCICQILFGSRRRLTSSCFLFYNYFSDKNCNYTTCEQWCVCVWKSEDYQNCRVNSIISTLLSDNIVIVCIVFVILSLCCWTMYQLCSVHNFISYSVDCRCCCRLRLNYSCEMLPFNTSVVAVSAYSEKAKYICSLYAVFCFHLWYTLLENLYVFTWRLSLVADQRSWLLLLIATQLSFVYCKTGQNDSCYCCGYCLIIIVSQSAFIVVFSLVSLVIVCWSYFHSQWQLQCKPVLFSEPPPVLENCF